MAGALLDAQWLVSSDRHPRDAGRAEIVEGDPLVPHVAEKKFRALYAGDEQMLPEQHRAIFVVGQPEDARRAGIVLRTFGVEALQQRRELLLDGNAARLTRLGAFHFARSSVDRLRDVDDPVLEIDVIPRERLELTGPRKCVRRGCVQDAKASRNQRSTVRQRGDARDQLQKFAGIEKLFGFGVAALGRSNSVARIVGTYP